MATDNLNVGGMPIKKVTLYDNGFAVFQREIAIQGHGSIDLFFSSDHMTSVLESLQFLGDANSNVGNIAYEVTKPEASIDVNTHEPLVGLIRSLIGRLISIEYQSSDSFEIVEGRILGVDEKLHDAEMKSLSEHVSVLVEGGIMRTLPIKSIRSFRILETQVRQDLDFSLDLMRSSGNEALQKISVFYADVESQKTLIARYGFRVNDWKSSYRMKLSDDPIHFQLDGLAIVENTLDEDWNDISLELVVGAPPIESKSSQLADQGVWKLNIKTLDGSFVIVRANPKDSVYLVKAKIAKKKGISPLSFRLIFAGKGVEEGRLLSDYTIDNNATLHMSPISTSASANRANSSSQSQFVMASQDNLSYYKIPMHVTAKRKQKAIVPLLQAQLEGQKVFLYDESIRKGNPLSAILFENTTGRTLEGGSLQISTSDVFLGQGLLPTLHPGDESPPIPYAVELACEVSKGVDSSFLKPHKVSITDGTVTITRIQREITLYRIKNKSDKDMDFLLNHLFLEDYDLVQLSDVEEEEPVDITDRFYQFRFTIPAHTEKKTFVVREEINDLKDHEIRDLSVDLLETWVNKKMIDSNTEQAIRTTFGIQKQIKEIQNGIYDKESEVREITSTQKRLRDNISALEGHEKEASKYIRSLGQEEDKWKGLQDSIKTDRQKKKNLEVTLSSAISAIQFSMDFPRMAAADKSI